MTSMRRWIPTTVIAIVAFGAGLLTHWYIDYQGPHFTADVARVDAYAVSADGRELTIFGSVGAGDLPDLLITTEDTDRVVVTFRSFRFVPAIGGFKNLAAYGVQRQTTLRDPLGARTVIDATTGNAVRAAGD
jgi:hypothetical protein